MKALWDSFWSLDWYWRRVTLACTAFVIGLTIGLWRVMVPMFLLAALVAAYLRHSRGRDSL